MKEAGQLLDANLPEERTLFGHPIGLYVLFMVEMWERFSYYGMRAILVLYMVSSTGAANSGLGWSNGNALALYGWYTMLVYVMGIPGGIIADKYIGQKKSVLYGGLILVAGHGVLAIQQPFAFYTGLILIILGVGLLKPNISTLVGGLYQQGDARRDSGFTIFYIGINTGAFLAAIIVGAVGERVGWHYGFGLAGIGMLLGQLTFMYGQKYLKGIGDAPIKTASSSSDDEQATTSFGHLFSNLFRSPIHLMATVALIIGTVVLTMRLNEPGFERYAWMALGIFLSLVVGVLMMVYKDINKVEKDRFVVLLISYLIVIVFWGAFEQAGGLMNIYTQGKIDREVSLVVLDSIFIIFGLLLLGKGFMDTRKKKDTNVLFFILGALVLVIYGILKAKVFTENPFEIPTSVFQSVNALFIMIFGTVVGGFWIWWANRGKEHSAIYKMAIGTIIMGVGFLFMAKASHDINMYGEKAGLILLILAYLLHTIGELCASPVALSFITKVAPIKYVSLMMGLYFAASGLGNKLAGTIGEASQTEPIKIEHFASNANLADMVDAETLKTGGDFEMVGKVAYENGQIVVKSDNPSLVSNLQIEDAGMAQLTEFLQSDPEQTDYTLICRMTYDSEQKVALEGGNNQADLTHYSGTIEVFEVQDKKEFKTFIGIFIFTVIFGILLLLFLKKLKRLTHGAEDDKTSIGH